MFDEQVMVGENLFEVDGPNLLTDGYNHEATCWRQWTSHRTASTLSDATLAQREGLHIQCRLEQGWYIFDHNLPGDVESTEGATLEKISWLIGFSRVDREDFIVSNVHMRAQEIQKHVPSPNESCLVNAGERIR